MKTIPSIIALLLLFNPLTAQQTGQPANPAVPGDATRPSATTGAPGMPEFSGVGGGGLGTGTAVPGSLPASNEFAIGLLNEEAEQDLASAAAAYRRTIQAFDRQRNEAANAIFRLGEVYRKMGRIEEAKVQYARILREFPDMVRLTELSHGLLLGEEGRAGTGIGPETGTTATGSASVTTSGRGPDDLDRILRGSYGAGISDRIMLQRYGLKPPLALDERVACISNLKQLGLAARIYAAEKDAVFPPSPALMSNEIAVTKVLVCPSDTARQPAPSWAEFDSPVHMTYEYLGAGVRENEPQRTLYHCPIHGHVALVDGSVQHGRQPSPGATVQVQPQRADRSPAESAPSEVYIINTILNRLRQIDGAKEQWALENRQPVGTQPTEQDIIRYLAGGWVPIAGERYELKPVGESSVAVLTRPIGNRQAGDRLTFEPSADHATETARIPAVVRIPVLVSSNGTIQLDGKQVEVAMLRARLHERTADLGQSTMVIIQADEEADFVRVAEVLEACRSAGVTNVTVAADLRPILHQEIERLTAEKDPLQQQAQERITFRGQIQESARARQMIAEARTQQEQARQRLDALSFPAERLPTLVSQDPRYQRLKAEYERAVLNGDEAGEIAARTRLQDWVEKIYLPELQSEVQLADAQRNQWERAADELEMLSARRREQEQQLGLLESQVHQLRKLLELTDTKPAPGTE